MSDDFENGPEASPAPEAAAEAPSDGAQAAASQPDADFDWESLRREFESGTKQPSEAEPVVDYQQQALLERENNLSSYEAQLAEAYQALDHQQDALKVDQLIGRLSKSNADFARQDRQIQLGILSSIYHASEMAREVWLHGDEQTQKTLEREVSRYLDRLYGEVADHARKSVIDENATETKQAIAHYMRHASDRNPPPAPAKNFSDMSESEFRREVTRATGFSLD